MPKAKYINPTAAANLAKVIEESKLSYEKFAKRVSTQDYPTTAQSVYRYAKGENEIPTQFALAVSKSFGVSAAWILGISPYKYPFDEAAIAVTDITVMDERAKRDFLFILLANINGWEYSAKPDIAAPYTGTGDAFDDTESAMLEFMYHAVVSRNGNTRTLTKLDYDNLITRMLGIFDVEIQNS